MVGRLEDFCFHTNHWLLNSNRGGHSVVGKNGITVSLNSFHIHRLHSCIHLLYANSDLFTIAGEDNDAVI
ncbi:MAG: hypothetical protein C0490_03990 [Marivirga sp.]|nr:hypothetical protein [Marivirga sp.]